MARRRGRSPYSEHVTDSDADTPTDLRERHRDPRPGRARGLRRLHAPGWGDRELDLPRHPVADWARDAPARLAEPFPGERLVVPAGGFKVRSNDTDYRFRADTAHVHLTGNQTSDAVLVVEDGESVLYARPRSSRRRPTSSSATAATASCGPVAGRRCRRSSDSLGLECRHLDDLADAAGRARPRPGCCAASTRTSTAAVAADAARDDELRPGALRAAPGQGRLGARRAARGLRHHHPRLRGRRPRVGRGPRARRALDRGHLLPPRPRRWATTSATTRSSPAARTPPRCTGPRTPARSPPASCCCSTWASRAATSTPPTSPARCRSTARFTPVQRDLYALVLPPSRPASTPYGPGRVVPGPHHAAMHVLAHGLEDLGPAAGVGGGGAVARQQGLHRAGRCTRPATCSAWTCTTAPQAAPEAYKHGDAGGGHGADRRARAVLPGGRPARPRGAARHRHPDRGRPRGHRRTGPGTSRAACPADPDAIEEWMAELRA